METAEQLNVATSPRERILAAARKIFLDGPPELATMDAVAQQAGMSKKTIYREFKSQLDLLAALLADNVADMGEFPPPSSKADIELELYGVVMRLVTHMTSARSIALFRLLISEVRRYPELMKHGKPKGFPRHVIADWLSSPTVRARYQIEDAEEAAAMLLGMVIQDSAFKLVLADLPMPRHTLELRARKAVAIFLRGVRRSTP
ncbi:MAG: TetR/AcrR family transcriptional regulator [Alphaproteobacteria bacterium]|nr:TetR/AcrR family transcriptional regulator [Alphaproteobacteria bacterium]